MTIGLLGDIKTLLKKQETAVGQFAPSPVKTIVVAEHPKSGGSWLVNLLGGLLFLPRRDIYVTDDPKFAFLADHPWYKDCHSYSMVHPSAVKSHERPDSPLHDFPAHFVHLVRDGRDVVVSKYFYDTEFCVKNEIYEKFQYAFEDIPFDDYVPRVAKQWRDYVIAWLDHIPDFVRYEDLLDRPADTLESILNCVAVTVEREKIEAVILENSVAKTRESLASFSRHNTFVRKAIQGDWRNHFEERHVRAFEQVAGDALERLGYR